jgi:hypothetical protein
MQVEIQIPTSLREINLKSYQDYMKLVQSTNDLELINHKTIEIFCGLRLQDAARIKATDVIRLIHKIDEVFKQKPEHIKRFKIKDIEFGFIPNLDDMSWGEYMDLEKYMLSWDTYHKALAVMYRPIEKDKNGAYRIVPYTGTSLYADVMQYAPLEVALGSSLFFWTLEKELYSHFLLSTKKLKMEMNEDMRTTLKELNLEKNGDGITAYIELLKETLQNLMQSPPSMSLQHLHS